MNVDTGLAQVEIRDAAGNHVARLELALASTTPDDVLEHLKSEQLVMAQDPQHNPLPASLWLGDRELVADRPLAQQGVHAGSVLAVQFRHVKGADRQRLQRERELLSRLEQRSRGRISVQAQPTLRQYDVTLRVRGPVAAASGGYTIAGEHLLRIWLPDSYPTAPPLLRLATPVLVPNCFSSGQPCLLSDKDPWHPVQTLVEVVHAVAELIQGVRPNLGSIANPQASELWREQGPQLRSLIGEPFVVPMVDLAGGAGINTVDRGVPVAGGSPNGRSPIRTL